MGMFALWDARELAKKNKNRCEHLEQRKAEAERMATNAQRKLDTAYTEAFDGYLSPFATTFALIKNVDLDDLPTTTAVPELATLDVKLRSVGLKAVESLSALAAGGAAGAAAGGMTFAAVGAFAAASTGTAISTLSGAAATSATLAWLGGGSLAAGGFGVAGGTAVLAGVVALPLLAVLGGFLWWKGEESYAEQREIKAKLKAAEAELDAAVARVEAATRRVKDTAKVTRRLTQSGVARLPEFEELVAGNVDYGTYNEANRAKVAELAGLATTIAAIIACPITDDEGEVAQLSDDAMAGASTLADRLEQVAA